MSQIPLELHTKRHTNDHRKREPHLQRKNGSKVANFKREHDRVEMFSLFSDKVPWGGDCDGTCVAVVTRIKSAILLHGKHGFVTVFLSMGLSVHEVGGRCADSSCATRGQTLAWTSRPTIRPSVLFHHRSLSWRAMILKSTSKPIKAFQKALGM